MYDIPSLVDQEVMMSTVPVSLTKVTRHGQVTLPAAVRRAVNVDEGDYIEVRVEGDTIILTPKKLIDKSQAYFWTAEWQAAEQEASTDITAGRVHEFEDIEGLIASLEAED
jgi:AbrB family looped-hinge helix DNA binding protein